MRRRWIGVGVLALLLTLVSAPAGDAIGLSPPPRLIADNKTAYYVNVLAWNGNGWNSVIRLMPGNFTTFPNAQNGSLWRAVIGQVVRDHQVRYVYDQRYGGYQDVWWIQ